MTIGLVVVGMYGMSGVNSMYTYIGNIEAATDNLSYTVHRLAGKTRTHLMLDGNRVYVREDEKESFLFKTSIMME